MYSVLLPPANVNHRGPGVSEAAQQSAGIACQIKDKLKYVVESRWLTLMACVFSLCVRHTLSLGAIKQGLIIRLLYKLRCLSTASMRTLLGF